MVTAEVLREDIRKLTQKAQEYLQQENFDGARAYQEQIKLLRQELAELTGGDVLLQLDVPCCLGMLLAPQPRALDRWLRGWGGSSMVSDRLAGDMPQVRPCSVSCQPSWCML